jgi:hypothetical protein
MDQNRPEQRAEGGVGEQRGGERRAMDRRRVERRTPPPLWRRPAAYVTYGVLGTLLLIVGFGLDGDEENEPEAEAAMLETSSRTAPSTPAGELPPGGAREAYTQAQFERLIAEGDQAVGQIVKAELYCGSINPVSMRTDQPTSKSLQGLVDGEGRVGGAECRWSKEAMSSDFLLIVPPELAEEFARAPEVELNFVKRRQIPAQIEWLGRSEALSLRTSGVLRGITL